LSRYLVASYGCAVPSEGDPHGWQPDPFGRYEERYYVYGEPTRLVRASGIESTDPQGTARSPNVVPRPGSWRSSYRRSSEPVEELPDNEGAARRDDPSPEPVASPRPPATLPSDSPKPFRHRRLLVAALIVLILLAGAGVTALFIRGGQSATDRYLGRVAAIARVDRTTVDSHRRDLLARRDAVCGSMLQESARVAYAFRDSALTTAAYQAALELTCPSRKVAFDRALAIERAADERLVPLGN